MDTPTPGLMNRDVQGHWVRLETLTRVRWLVVAGQIAALLAARFVFELEFALVVCLSVVGVSAVSNVLSAFVFPRSKRLSGTNQRTAMRARRPTPTHTDTKLAPIAAA